MTTKAQIAAIAAIASAVLLTGCVGGGYYSEVSWSEPVIYGPRYPNPYYGGYYPRYDPYDRYDRSYYRRYDRRYGRRYDRPRRPDYAERRDYQRPSRPDPVVVQPQPQPQPPRVQPRPLPAGRLNCGGAADAAGMCDPRGRGEGWGKMN